MHVRTSFHQTLLPTLSRHTLSPRETASVGFRMVAAMTLVVCLAPGAVTHAETDPRESQPWPPSTTGQNSSYRIVGKETLVELAPETVLGYDSLRRANPAIDPWLPKPGDEVLLPHFTIVPDEVVPGITINLPEYRLYFLSDNTEGCQLQSFPAGIGSEQFPTPTGVYTVGTKIVNPWWKVPTDIRKERKLPAVVPPGKDNPLGGYWLGISGRGIGIHGTNEPFGIGRLSSHGCIRLYPADAEKLFPAVAIGTRVRIINQSIKLGIKLDALFLEVHPRLYGQEIDPLAVVLHQIERLEWRGEVDWREVELSIQEARGIPRVIGFYRSRTALAK